jgi:hypothetical protein
MLHTRSVAEMVDGSGAYTPDINTGPADASKDTAHNESIHAGGSTTYSRTGFKEQNASDEQCLDVVDGIEGHTAHNMYEQRVLRDLGFNAPWKDGRNGAEGKASADPSELGNMAKAVYDCGLYIGSNGSVETVDESADVE